MPPDAVSTWPPGSPGSGGLGVRGSWYAGYANTLRDHIRHTTHHYGTQPRDGLGAHAFLSHPSIACRT